MAARLPQRYYDNIQFRWAPGREGDTLQAVNYRMTWRGSISETLGNFWVDNWAYLSYKPGESKCEASLGPRRGVWTVRKLDDESKNVLAAFVLLRVMHKG